MSVLWVPAPARADATKRLVLRAELAIGMTMPAYQRDELAYGLIGQGSVRLGVRVVEPAALQLSFMSTHAPSEKGAGLLQSITGGLRIEPRIATTGRLFLDTNLGLGLTGELTRFTLDAAVGFDLDLGGAVDLGPVVRYTHLFATEEDFPSDAQFVALGLSLSLHAPPPRRDADGDDVLDHDDLCVDVPEGDRPDPRRPGCPLTDRDGDGVPDASDTCIDVPAGPVPDPARLGCPAADVDADGVYDHADRCPTTPRGATPDPRRPGCPALDQDGDGLADPVDRCPTQPGGPRPDPARPGCPSPDQDGDMVPDADDACPTEPGAPSRDPRRNGCPGLVRIEGQQIHILRPVFFATNRDVILPTSEPVLQAVGEALLASPRIRRVSIGGHTDDVADDAFNMDLSQRRANNVMAWLIRYGVEPGRLQAHGFGEGRPLVGGTSRDARAANRRVEFHIVDPAGGEPHTGGTE
jgi:outer membrane protein OmpA-like peptidoglycan-associated protein